MLWGIYYGVYMCYASTSVYKSHSSQQSKAKIQNKHTTDSHPSSWSTFLKCFLCSSHEVLLKNWADFPKSIAKLR